MGLPSNESTGNLSEAAALKAAHLGIWEMDVQRKVLRWDQQCQLLFQIGFSYSASLTDFLSVVFKDDVVLVTNTFESFFNQIGNQELDIAFRFQTETNDHRWIRLIGSCTTDGHGRLAYLGGVARDVTQDKIRQYRAETNEEKLHNLIQRAPFGIGVYESRDMIIDIANPAILKAWGKTSEVLGMRLSDALSELDSEPFITLLTEVFDTGITYSAAEQEVKMLKNGILQSFWFNFTFEPLMDAEGNVYGILNMVVDVTEKVEARKSIEERRTQLLSSFDQAPVAIALLSAQNLIFEIANQFCLDLVGRESDQVIGKSMNEALPELDGQGFDLLLAEVVATGKPYGAPEVSAYLMRNNNLEKIYVDLTFQPQFSSNGDVSGILVVVNDITQQVTARKRIEQSEQKLQTVIASAPAAMALFVSRELIIDLPNQAFIEMIGKGKDISGRPLAEVMPELINQPYLQIMDDVFTSGKMFQSYAAPAFVVHDGQVTHGYYNFSNTPLCDESGEVYAILTIAIDVTEEIVAKQKIAEAEEHLRGAVELAQMATWSFDLKRKSITLSDRLKDWLGLTDDVVEPSDLYHQLPLSYRIPVEKALNSVLEPDSSGVYQSEHPIISKSTGQERIIHTQARIISNSDGSPAMLIGSALDVTEQRQLQINLERQVKERTEDLEASNIELAASNNHLELVNNLLIRSNQNLEQFAYIASHDLQEPLRKIRQFGDLLRQQFDSPTGNAAMYIDRMHSAASRMSVLIDDLLTFARISSNKEENEIINLDDVIQHVISDLELRIQETDARIEITSLPAIVGNKVQLGQLFMNLLNNALKFHKPNIPPHVVVRSKIVSHLELTDKVKPAYWADHYHLIEVADNGIGFDERYTERIFQVFQRLHGKSEFSGTGIGLAICEKVVVNHGGAITAKSTEGEGSTFQIYFPVASTKVPKS